MVHYRILNRVEFGAPRFHEKKTLGAFPSSPLPFPSPPSPPQEPNQGGPESLGPRYDTIDSRRAGTLSFHISRRETWESNLGKAPFSEMKRQAFVSCPTDALETAPASLPDHAERSQLGAISLKKKKMSFTSFYLCAQNSLISGNEHFRLWVLWKQENKRKKSEQQAGRSFLFIL